MLSELGSKDILFHNFILWFALVFWVLSELGSDTRACLQKSIQLHTFNLFFCIGGWRVGVLSHVPSTRTRGSHPQPIQTTNSGLATRPRNPKAKVVRRGVTLKLAICES